MGNVHIDEFVAGGREKGKVIMEKTSIRTTYSWVSDFNINRYLDDFVIGKTGLEVMRTSLII